MLPDGLLIRCSRRLKAAEWRGAEIIGYTILAWMFFFALYVLRELVG